MFCRNTKQASFHIYAYGDKACDPVRYTLLSYADYYDTNKEFIASVKRVGEIFEKDNVVKDAMSYYHAYDPNSELQLWHVPVILLCDVFRFSHRYVQNYKAKPNGSKELIIIYNDYMPVWFLKRVE